MIFIKYFILTGTGSGIVTIIFDHTSLTPVVGASGAVYGVLMAYALAFPNRIVYIYFLFPIRVKYFVMILGGIAFFSSLGSPSNISHLTHLSGMVIGFVYLRYYWHWKDFRFSVHKQIEEFRSSISSKRDQKKIEMQNEVDQLLDKINETGYDNLTEEEKDLLYRASKDFSQGRKKD